MKKIGLVLNGPISYSLTFIANEIRIWQELGFEVVVFLGRENQEEALVINVRTVVSLPVKGCSLLEIPTIVSVLLKLVAFGLLPTARFFKSELSAGTSFIQTVKKTYKVAHILPFKMDVIHFGFGNVALHKEYLAKAMGAKMSVSFRGADICILPLSNALLYKSVWEKADKIHFISNDLHQQAIKYGLKQNEKARLIYQTLDLDLIPVQVPAMPLNAPLQLLTVARLHWKKGLEHTLEVVSNLTKQGIDCRYTIVGDGPHEQAIRYAISDLGLEHIVSLLGALPYRQVLTMMSGTDVYIQGSIQEGFCNAVLEAQACGVLTVATNAEGIHENIINDMTGWVVPKRDVNAMTDKIKYILSLPVEEKQKIKERAAQRVRQEFYLNRYKENWHQFFNA
ncbi:MAG: colanic acid biosynthesis glycosyltransferase WcaL [Chitinophagaceae bacterium]|nr:colanic acid biosynthesis glycosyltransferase WcaL [Chitinophagaceae bacterium]